MSLPQFQDDFNTVSKEGKLVFTAVVIGPPGETMIKQSQKLPRQAAIFRQTNELCYRLVEPELSLFCVGFSFNTTEGHEKPQDAKRAKTFPTTTRIPEPSPMDTEN